MDHIDNDNNNFKNNDDIINEDTPKITIIFEEDLRNTNKNNTDNHPFNLLFSNLLKDIDKETKNIKIEYDIDYYSSIGNIKCLDNWFNKNLKNSTIMLKCSQEIRNTFVNF